MDSKRVSTRPLRDLQRAVHLVSGLLLAAHIYTPPRDLPSFALLVQLVVIPLIIATVMATWQLPRFGPKTPGLSQELQDLALWQYLA